MRVCTYAGLALGALVGSAARPSYPQPVDEATHKLDAKPFSPCIAGLRIWVRADDLRSSSVSEGDARLVNNLTHVAHDADLVARCRVQSWTLGLRHRERVALKFPAPDVELPAEPQWNSTWGLRRHGWDKNPDEASLDTVFSPHTSEKQAYDAKLEEYARAIRNHDHWIVLDEERVNFEAEWPMGLVEEPLEDLQVVDAKPFAIAVPAVVFPPKVSHRPSMIFSGTTNVSYAEEVDLAYFARITLSDNEVIEIAAGETTFLPPALWSHRSRVEAARSMSLRFDADTEVNLVRGWNEKIDVGSGSRTLKLENLDLTLRLDDVPAFVQGDKKLLNGTFVFGNSAYEVDSAKFKVTDQVRPSWAAAKLQEESRNTSLLLAELYQKTGQYNVSSSGVGITSFGYSSNANSVPASAASHLDRAVRGNKGRQSLGTRDVSWGIANAATLQPLDTQTGTSSFTTWANFSDDGAFTSRLAAFETIDVAIIVDLTIRERSDEPKAEVAPKPTLSRSEQTLQGNAAWQGGWSSSNYCCEDENDDEGKKPAKRGNKYHIRATFEDLEVLPRAWPERKRNGKLQQALRDRSACKAPAVSHLFSEARAPIFVDPNTTESVVGNLCSASSRFPRLNATTRLRQRRPASEVFKGLDSTLRFITNRWRDHNVLSHEAAKPSGKQPLPGRGSSSGSARNLVGKTWAQGVLLPIVKAEKRAAAAATENLAQKVDDVPQVAFAQAPTSPEYQEAE